MIFLYLSCVLILTFVLIPYSIWVLVFTLHHHVMMCFKVASVLTELHLSKSTWNAICGYTKLKLTFEELKCVEMIYVLESVSFTKSAQFLFTGHFVSSSQGVGLFLPYLFICSVKAFEWTNPICFSRLSLQIIYFPYLRFTSADSMLNC